MKIIIGGDVVPYGAVEKLFEDGNIDDIMGSQLKSIWFNANYRMFNLECPITNKNSKLYKFGPSLKCSLKCINGISKMKPSCLFLANNHIMDYSIEGFNDTINVLDENNIKWIGAGQDLNNMTKSMIIEDNGIKVGFLNYCESEFSFATEKRCGANRFDIFEYDTDIAKLKELTDFLVIIYHGGKELYRYPSPILQKKCRKMIELGANIVICQHSHCIGSEEVYKNGTIIYGQGNFIFNKKQNEYWNTSLLVQLDVNKRIKVEYIPIIQSPNGSLLANEEESKRIIDEFRNRSKLIKNKDFLVKEYRKLSSKNLDYYLVMATGNRFFPRFLNKFFKKKYSKINRNYAAILNLVECESISELFIEGLKDRIKNGDDSIEK